MGEIGREATYKDTPKVYQDEHDEMEMVLHGEDEDEYMVGY